LSPAPAKTRILPEDAAGEIVVAGWVIVVVPADDDVQPAASRVQISNTVRMTKGRRYFIPLIWDIYCNIVNEMLYTYWENQMK